MTGRRVLGVDPGAKGTGLALIDGGRLLYADTVRTGLDPLKPGRGYLAAITGTMEDVIERTGGVDFVAVEGVVRPNPHVRRGNGRSLTDPTHIIAAAIALGAVLAHPWPARVLVVRPGGNGSGFLGEYPPELVSDAERRATGWKMRQAGSGRLKDQRSAYDVARTAVQSAALLNTEAPLAITYLY